MAIVHGEDEPAAEVPTTDGPHMARTLGLWAAVGLSLALVAPSQAVNINPQAAVPFVGKAVPLAFLAAFVAVLLVAYGITRLAQRINGSGSLSTLVAQSVTHRAGAVTGWLLCGAYVLFVVVQAVTCSIFLGALLNGLGIAHSIPDGVTFLIAFGLLAAATLVACLRIQRAIGLLMTFEIGTIVLIVVVMAIVACTVIFSHGPRVSTSPGASSSPPAAAIWARRRSSASSPSPVSRGRSPWARRRRTRSTTSPSR